MRSLRPALSEICAGVDVVGASRGKLSGTVRITATKHAVSSVILPVLRGFLPSHPDIQVELITDDNLVDIVAERLDAGIRFGDIVEKDMIAVRVGPDIRMSVVGAPSYFEDYPAPKSPRDLATHRASVIGSSNQAVCTLGISRRRHGALRCVSKVLLSSITPTLCATPLLLATVLPTCTTI